MKDRSQAILSIIINIFLVLSTAIIIVYGVHMGAGAGQLGFRMYGWGYLKAYTNLSNLLAGIAAAFVLFFELQNLGKAEKCPRSVFILQYSAAVSVGLTFLIVVCFLGPMFAVQGLGYFTMFSGEMIFFHLLNPLLCGVDFVLLQKQHILTRKDNFLALLPTLLYSLVYLTMVVFVGTWDDFYNFTLGGHYALSPLCMLVIYTITYGIAFLQRRLHNKMVRTNK